jgi:hypothetical protein
VVPCEFSDICAELFMAIKNLMQERQYLSDVCLFDGNRCFNKLSISNANVITLHNNANRGKETSNIVLRGKHSGYHNTELKT